MGWFYILGVTAFLVFLIIIGVVCGLATISVALGMGRGIKVLSTINIWAAVRLLVFVLLAGSTLYTLKGTIESFGVYLASLPQLAFWNDTFADTGWQNSWTVFYWAWTITWSPFVGIFIARISRGRTIREFVTGVILIPSTVTLLWFAIFGGAAITAQQNGTDLASQPIEGQLFGLLHTLPLGNVLSIIAMTLTAIFFVSGADAASIVMGTLSQRGTIHPSKRIVVFWGVMMGSVAALMLVIGGTDALSGIQNITIIMAAPFVLVMIAMCVALYKDLRHDPLVRRGERIELAVEQAIEFGTKTYGDSFYLPVKPHKIDTVDGTRAAADESNTTKSNQTRSSSQERVG